MVTRDRKEGATGGPKLLIRWKRGHENQRDTTKGDGERVGPAGGSPLTGRVRSPWVIRGDRAPDDQGERHQLQLAEKTD